MRPVHESAQVVPLIHATYAHPVAHPKRDAFGEIDIVRDEQRAAIADVDNEALMARTVVIIGQQSPHEARDFDPLTIISFCERWVQCMKKARWAVPGHRAICLAAGNYPCVTGTIVISTRRLAWRPDVELLSPTGRDSPIPTVITRWAITPWPCR